VTAAVTGSTSTASSLSDVIAAIEAAAKRLGVDPDLAIADAYAESGLDPTAVGDNGTSFGLYQLHQGGELTSAGLTPAEAFNPTTNAQTALAEFAAVQRANPTASPGEIAALAQRPADPSAYASTVNALLSDLKSGTGAISQAVRGAAPGAAAASASQGSTSSGSTSSGPTGLTGDILRVAVIVLLIGGALALMVLGVTRLFPGSSSSVPIPIPV